MKKLPEDIENSKLIDDSLMSKNMKSSFSDESPSRKKSISVNESRMANINSMMGKNVHKKEVIKKAHQEIYLYSELSQKMKIKMVKKTRPPSGILRIQDDYQKNRSLPQNERLKSLKIIKMPDLEYIQRYNDSLPLLSVRKAIWRLFRYFK